MAWLLYGTGIRLMECVWLRIKDVDFTRGTITVRSSKGDKDRVTVLPDTLREQLHAHIEHLKGLHAEDRKLIIRCCRKNSTWAIENDARSPDVRGLVASSTTDPFATD